MTADRPRPATCVALLAALLLAGCANDAQPGAATPSAAGPDAASVADAADAVGGDAAAAPEHPFITGRVLTVSLELSEAAWQAILANPTAEEEHEGAIVYDGARLDGVGIRTKGNSSLMSVAAMGSTRFSFKVDMNSFVSGQRLLGIKKLNFNNGFKDPSLMREHLAYQLAADLGLPAPRTAFADLTVAGHHLGLYTVVEQVDSEFIDARFPVTDGDLYKPELPGGTLVYAGTTIGAYGGLELKTNETTSDHAAFLRLVDVLVHGTDAELAEVLDVDEALRYLALGALLVNLDSYNGNGHNYYLYEQAGVFSVIPWDLNEAFGNFRCGCDRDGVLAMLVDEPTCAPVSERPLVDRLLSVAAHRDAYHAHLQGLLDGPFAPATMAARITETAALIRPTVQAQTVTFYSAADFETALTTDVVTGAPGGGGAVGAGGAIGLQAFVDARAAAVAEQLAGTSPAAGDGGGGCAGGGGPGPNAKCPDGVCDAFEQANPTACPQDCP